MAINTHTFTFSGNLQSGTYDDESGEMIIAFKGGSRYSYSQVSREDWAGLTSAKSAGKYLHSHIKGVYAFKKL